jgi:hypothetical protein
MNIALDLDDTLIAFRKPFVGWLSKKFLDRKIEDQESSAQFAADFPFSRAEIMEQFSFFYQTCASLPGLPGVYQKLIRLQQAGHFLFVVTARPTSTWTETHCCLSSNFPGIAWHGIRFTSFGPKLEALKEIQADVLIEDNPNEAKAITKCAIPVILLRRPWNQNFEFQSPFLIRSHDFPDEIV